MSKDAGKVPLKIIFGKQQGIGTRRTREDVVSQLIDKRLVEPGPYGALKSSEAGHGIAAKHDGVRRDTATVDFILAALAEPSAKTQK